MNDQEKIAAIRLGKRLGLAMRRTARAIGNYGRNISGKAVRDAEKGLSRVVAEGKDNTDRLTRELSVRNKVLSSLNKKMRHMSERIRRNSNDASKYIGLARGKKLVPSEIGRGVSSAHNDAAAAQARYDHLKKMFPDQNLRPDKSFREAMQNMADTRNRAASVDKALDTYMTGRAKDQADRILNRRASRDAKLSKALSDLVSSRTAAMEDVNRAKKDLAKAVSESAARKKNMEDSLANALKARRAARANTAVYGGGTAGGIGLGALLSLSGGQEKKSSHDPAMRKVAEVLAAFVEGMECRR